MRFGPLLISVAAIMVTALAIPEPPVRARSADFEEVILYAPHACDSGWYATGADTDTVTIHCYTPDPPQERDPE